MGLNLTRATIVVHVDRPWNPAVEAQATDRAHRIGQVNTVHVYRFITVGTFEEHQAKILKSRLSLTKVFRTMDRDAFFFPGSEKDAASLLPPFPYLFSASSLNQPSVGSSRTRPSVLCCALISCRPLDFLCLIGLQPLLLTRTTTVVVNHIGTVRCFLLLLLVEHLVLMVPPSRLFLPRRRPLLVLVLC